MTDVLIFGVLALPAVLFIGLVLIARRWSPR